MRMPIGFPTWEGGLFGQPAMTSGKGLYELCVCGIVSIIKTINILSPAKELQFIVIVGDMIYCYNSFGK